jgi:pyrimidine operon attenuation protein/uracil phosphoribosyltransferase
MRNLVLNGESLELTLLRMAHEIAETNIPGDDLVLVGIQRGGVAVARRLNPLLSSILGISIPMGTLDVTMHRDDLDWHRVPEMRPTEIPFDLDSRNVVLIDDVLYHGRTVRAALDALHELGRPKCVQLAVLIDRGHRKLPIHADFVGKQIPTQTHERVFVRLGSDPGTGEVWLAESSPSGS